MKIGKIKFPKLKFPKVKYARAPVIFAVVFAAFSIVLSLASPRLRIAFTGGSGNYRWRYDNGSETAATFAAAENTPATVPENVTMRLRMAVSHGNSPDAIAEKNSTTLDPGDGSSTSVGVVDPVNGYAYYAISPYYNTTSKIIKFSLGSGTNAPTRIGTLTLNTGENNITSAVIDTANGYAYFGTNTLPGKVIKIALGSGNNLPTEVGSITLNTGENRLLAAAIDPGNGYAYFATYTATGIIVKVALGGSGLPSRVSALTLNSGEGNVGSLSIDTTNGYLYASGDTGNVSGNWPFYKIGVNAGDAAPTRVAALNYVGANCAYITASVLEVSRGLGWIFGYNGYPCVVKITLGSGNAAPTYAGYTQFGAQGISFGKFAQIDTVNRLAYIGDTYGGGGIDKINLGGGSVTLASGCAGAQNYQGGIDIAHGYLYATIYNVGSVGSGIIKCSFGTGGNGPAFVAGAPIKPPEVSLLSAVSDPAAGYAYFGTSSCMSCVRGYGSSNGTALAGTIVKMKFNNGSAPTRLGSLMLNYGEDVLYTAAIDTTNKYAYFGTDTAPGKIIKVALGTGDALPTEVATLTLQSGENYLTSSVIDVANGYAYFGTYTSPGKVIKIALGSGSSPPTEIGAVTLGSGQNMLTSAVIDPANGYAYFGTYTSPGIVIKVSLGSGTNLPAETAALALQTGYSGLTSAVIDTTDGYAYFSTSNYALLYGAQTEYAVRVWLGAGSDPPTSTDAAGISSGTNNLVSAVYDPATGNAYFGADQSPGKVASVVPGATPANGATVSANSGESYLRSAAIDSTNGYVYFGTNYGVALGSYSGTPDKIVMFGIRPSPSYRLEYGRKTSTCGAISSWTQVPATATSQAWQMQPSAYVTDGTATSDISGITNPDTTFVPGQVMTASSQASPIVLLNGDFTELEYSLAATGNAVTGGDYCFRLTDAGAVTPYTGNTYPEATIYDYPAQYRWRNDDGSEASATFAAPEGQSTGVEINSGMRLRMVAGNDGSAPDLSLVSRTDVGGSAAFGVAIGAANGFEYYAGDSSGANTIFWKVSAENGTATVVGSVNVGAAIFAGAIDPIHDYAYLGVADSDPTREDIVKIKLNGSGAPTRISGALELAAPEQSGYAAVIDAANGYAYFAVEYGNSHNVARVVKIKLPADDALPTELGSEPGIGGENNFSAAAIDTANGYAYFAGDVTTNPGTVEGVVKIGLGTGDADPTRIGAATVFGSANVSLLDFAIDAGGGYGYAISNSDLVTKVSLGAGSAPPGTLGTLTLTLANGDHPANIVADPANGVAYLLVSSAGGNIKIAKIFLGSGANDPTQGEVFGTLISAILGQPIIDTANEYLYFGNSTSSVFWKYSLSARAQFELQYGAKQSTCGAIASWTTVPGTAATEAWSMAPSTNVTDGEATTQNLGFALPNGIFVPGQVKTANATASPVSLAVNDFSEYEFSIKPTANATDGQDYCFRLADVSSGSPAVTPLAGNYYAEGWAVAPPPPTLNSPADGMSTASTSVDFSWNAVAGVDSYNITISDIGTFNTVNTSYTTDDIAAGSYTWSVTAVLGGYETAPSATRSFTILATPPAPATPNLTVASDTGVSATDNITNDTAPEFVVSCETGDTVTLRVDGNNDNTGLCAGAIATIAISAQSSGTYSIDAFQTNPSAVTGGDSPALSVTIDTDAPTVSSVAVQSGLTVNVVFSELMGTGATDPSNYTVSGSGQGTLATNPDSVLIISGNIYTLTWNGGIMHSGGDITVTVANAEDLAGNAIGSPNSGTDAGDAIGATSGNPGTPNLTVASDTGVSSTDNITNDTAPEFVVSCATGDTVTLRVDGNNDNTGLCAGAIATIAISAQSSGTYSIDAFQTDPANNVSGDSPAMSVTIDTDAPTVSSVAVQSGLTVNVIFSELMGTGATDPANYTVSGSGQGTLATHPDSVDIISGNTYTLTWNSGIMSNGGDITITVQNAQDVAGNAVLGSANAGTAPGGAIASPPPAPGTPDLTDASDTGIDNTDNITNDTTPEFNISCEDGDTVTLVVNEANDNSGTCSGGTATIVSSAQPSGTYEIEAIQTDGAQNASDESSDIYTTIDTDAPTVSSVAVQSGLTVNVVFSELMGTGATDPANYAVSGSGQGTLAANPDSVDLISGSTYALTWNGGRMTSGGDITVTVANAEDLAGNAIGSPDAGTDANGGLATQTTHHAPSSGGGGATAPVITAPSGGSNSNNNANVNTPPASPVEPGTTDATYHFTNPGNADSFNLYDAPPGSSMRPLASNSDPTATSITETGLTPNTTYSNRVVTAVANDSESSPSPSFPTFTTLLNNLDSITASYDETTKTVSLTATGNLPNLTVGQSGVDFTIEDVSGTVLFDSGFLQSPSPVSLASVDLEPGETYTVTVTPRNQDGVLSPPEDFTVAIPAGTEIKAKITLTKSAEKTDFPSAVNALTRETTQNTKEIKYTITASNTGNGIAKTFILSDPLPEGIDFKSGSVSVVKNLNDLDDVVNTSYDAATRTVTATLDELEPGESFTVTFVATPSPNTASSTVKNKASASWEE
jgi:uncharacterized repeat protein (TIGR01451 family)